jgi:hypothetical protein
MKEPISVSVSAIIDAPAGAIHRVLADYVDEHPKIVPKPFFERIVVEEGGRGAGTIYRADLRVWGTRQSLRMVVTEPDPGRVIREADPDAGVVTTFTLEPVDDGARTQVTISTLWAPKPGLRGLFERWANPRISRPVYEKELVLLGRHLSGEGR